MLNDIYNTLQLLVQKVGELTATIKKLQGIDGLGEQDEKGDIWKTKKIKLKDQ